MPDKKIVLKCFISEKISVTARQKKLPKYHVKMEKIH